MLSPQLVDMVIGDSGVCGGRWRGGFYEGLCQPSSLGTCGWSLRLCWWKCHPPCHAASGGTFTPLLYVEVEPLLCSVEKSSRGKWARLLGNEASGGST